MVWPAPSNDGPPTGVAAFTTPKSQRCSNAIADHVKARGIKQIQAFAFCSWCAHTVSPGRALNVVSVAWRAGGSPGAPEARLARRKLAWRAGGSPWSALPSKKQLVARMARRRLALVSSAFQNNHLARLACRKLALISSAFQINQVALASQGQSRTTHGQGHSP